MLIKKYPVANTVVTKCTNYRASYTEWTDQQGQLKDATIKTLKNEPGLTTFIITEKKEAVEL